MFKIYGARIVSKKIDLDSMIKYSQNLSNSDNITFQLFDADFIYGSDHLKTALEHAKRAYSQDRQTASTLGMETLLYASGEYQIKNAIEKVGLKENSEKLAILLHAEDNSTDIYLDKIFDDFIKEFELTRDNEVLNGDVNTLNSFGISKEELSAVPKNKWLELILEKVALVDIIK
jgi:KEOPS complex subunit Cgi121